MDSLSPIGQKLYSNLAKFMRYGSMVHEARETERRQAEDLANEFIEEDLLPENVENDVLRHLEREESIRALRIILRHRKGRV